MFCCISLHYTAPHLLQLIFDAEIEKNQPTMYTSVLCNTAVQHPIYGAMCIELDRWIVDNTSESGTLEYIGIH